MDKGAETLNEPALPSEIEERKDSYINWNVDYEMEIAVIACCVIHPESCQLVLSLVTEEDFSYLKLRAIFTAIIALNKLGQPADRLLIREWIYEHNKEMLDWKFLVGITSLFPDVLGVRHYCTVIREYSNRRKLHSLLLEATQKIEQSGYFTDVLQDLAVKTEKLTGITRLKTISAHGPAAVEKWRKIKDNTDKYPRWYIEALSDFLGPLHGSQIIIIAGGAKSGKTSLMFAQSLFQAEKGRIVGLFPLEMSTFQMLRRLVILKMGQDPYEMSDVKLTGAENAIAALEDDKLYIDDNARTLPEILIAMRQMIVTGRVKTIFVDYIACLL